MRFVLLAIVMVLGAAPAFAGIAGTDKLPSGLVFPGWSPPSEAVTKVTPVPEAKKAKPVAKKKKKAPAVVKKMPAVKKAPVESEALPQDDKLSVVVEAKVVEEPAAPVLIPEHVAPAMPATLTETSPALPGDIPPFALEDVPVKADSTAAQ